MRDKVHETYACGCGMLKAAMRRRWPFFEPWPRNPRVRRAITVGFSVAGLAAVGTVIVGPSLTWLSITIVIALWAILVTALVIERPKRRTQVMNDGDARNDLQ
jgi:hypothetical protein